VEENEKKSSRKKWRSNDGN